MEIVNLDTLRSVAELDSYQTDVRARIRELEQEYQGLPLPDEPRAEYAALQAADQQVSTRTQELRAREAYIRTLDEQPNNRAPIGEDFFGSPRTSLRDQDVFDLTTIRSEWGDPEGHSRELIDRARRAVDLARFPVVERTAGQGAINELLDRADRPNVVARHVLVTGSPLYARAFGKTIVGQPLSGEEQRALSAAINEQRALSLGTTGIPIPYTLDPTLLPVSNSSVNPWRAVGRVIPITVDEWRGATSAGITAAFVTEGTEATDNTPTLAQPNISTEKAHAFVPFSIESGMDWPSLQSDIGRDFQDAKDDLEASKFTVGTGTNEPAGIITGTTNTVNATTGQTFDAEDIYRLEVALPPRYRPRARVAGNRAIYNLARQFDTAGGAQLWLRIGDGLRNAADGALGEGLLGYLTYESSAMAASAATGNKFLLIGDFGRFVIIDRIGMQVEVIPHLFGAASRFPTGQRGLYMYWRVGSKLVDANATRCLIGIA